MFFSIARLFALVLVCASLSQALTIDISGTLTDSTGKAVDNASVKLLLGSLTTTTSSSGSFELAGDVATGVLRSSYGNGHEPSILVSRNVAMVRQLLSGVPVRAELFAAQGRQVTRVFHGASSALGGVDIRLSGIGSESVADGVHFLRLIAQGQVAVVKLAKTGRAWAISGGSCAVSHVDGSALGKQAAAGFLDTMEIRKGTVLAGKWILTSPTMPLGVIRSVPKRVSHALILDVGKGTPMICNRIEPGSFTMGSPGSEPGRGAPMNADETAHQVTITKPYYMGIYEVTQTQYKAATNLNPSSTETLGPNRPVDHMSVSTCIRFGVDAGKASGWTVRMPTEAEWEFAYRAGTQTAYFFGSDAGQLSKYAWFSLGVRASRDVGKLLPNPNGLYDIAGNMWEWLADWYGAYSSAPQTDPFVKTGVTDGVFRGGGTFNGAECQRAASRHQCPRSCADACMGFRALVEAK